MMICERIIKVIKGEKIIFYQGYQDQDPKQDG